MLWQVGGLDLDLAGVLGKGQQSARVHNHLDIAPADAFGRPPGEGVLIEELSWDVGFDMLWSDAASASFNRHL